MGQETEVAPARKSIVIGARRRANTFSGKKSTRPVPEQPVPKRSDAVAPITKRPDPQAVEKVEEKKEKEEKKVSDIVDKTSEKPEKVEPQTVKPESVGKKDAQDEKKEKQKREKILVKVFLADYSNSSDSWIKEMESITKEAEGAEQQKTLVPLISRREYVEKWISDTKTSMVRMRSVVSEMQDEKNREQYQKKILICEHKIRRLERRCATFDNKCDERKQRLQEISEENERELLNQAKIEKIAFDRMLGLGEMDMDGSAPKQIPDMAKLHEATLVINELGRKKRAYEEPTTETAIASRNSTNEIIEQMKASAKEFEKRYNAYILATPGHAKESQASREQEMVNKQKRATYLEQKRNYQSKDRERMAKMLADPESGVMRLIAKLKQLKDVEGNVAKRTAARALAAEQDSFDSFEEVYDPVNEWVLGEGSSLASTGTTDVSDMLKGFAKAKGEKGKDLFNGVDYMSLLAPLVDGLNIIHDVYVFMKNSKHMTTGEKLKGIGKIIVDPGISFLMDGATAVLTLLGTLDSIPIIGTFIGIVKSAVKFAQLLVRYYHALDDHYAMQEKKEFLRKRLEETKRKLEVKGAKGEADMVKLPEETRKKLKKNALLAHAERLTAGFSAENIAEKQSEWKEELRKGDETHRKEYYQAKVSQITKDYLMADDVQVKSNKALSDLTVDVTRESMSVASTLAKMFPGVGTAVGITIDAVSFLLAAGYKGGKAIAQAVTDHKHADADDSSQSKTMRASSYSQQLINDLSFLSEKINTKGEYIGQDQERSYTAAKMNNLRQMLKHARCPISKLISAKTMDQFSSYIASAFA